MIKSFLKQCGPYVLIWALLTALFYSTGYNRNWSFWADQELTLGYNGLLINSGLNQEYTDHPGFFSIHLIALLLKVASFLGLTQIDNLTQFNLAPSMFEAMRSLVIGARHAALVTTFVLLCGVYYLSNRIFRSTSVALLVACLAFVSNGVFYHFTATRTEPIAFLFLMLSLYYFIASYKYTTLQSYSYLQLCLICFFCAALNKAQIIVLAPFYFCWATYFISHENLSTSQAPQKNWYLMMGALTYGAVIAFYFNQSMGIGFLFNIALVSFFNLLIFGIACKIRHNNPFVAIAIFNTCYLSAFLLVEFVSTWVNLGNSLFGNIADPFSMTRFLKGPESALITISSTSKDLQSLLTFLVSPLVETFGKFTSPTLLIGFCVGYLIYHRRTITLKEWCFAGFTLISFYIVNLVNKIRYLDNPHYRIFSEFFLFTFVLLLIFKMPQRLQKRTLAILIFLTLLVNLVPYTNYYNWLIRKGSHPFCQSGLINVHQKMAIKRIEQECTQASSER